MTQQVPDFTVTRLPGDFDRWPELLALITRAFAYMDGIIDPPSSARLLTAASLRDKAAAEICFIATNSRNLAGCVFVAQREKSFYVGKLAVDPEFQRAGVGRALLQAVDAFARQSGKPVLELQTRVELEANHAAFRRLGFVEVARTAHPGFDRPTSITFRKLLQ